MSKRVALVTGASSGFGRSISEHLAREGLLVFGTTRKPRVEESPVEMLVLDVTSTDSVEACVRQVLDRAGQLDVLVANAGIAHASFVEETAPENAERVFETNFWGAVRTARAVLPSMRARRSGHIVFTSSLAGLVAAPGQAFYAASKHALEGFAEALRTEVQAFGISVTLVEPGFFRTGLHASLTHTHLPIADYDRERAGIEAAYERAIAGGGDPKLVAERVTAIVRTPRPALRYRVGRDAATVPLLRAILPERWFQAGMRRRFGLD